MQDLLEVVADKQSGKLQSDLVSSAINPFRTYNPGFLHCTVRDFLIESYAEELRTYAGPMFDVDFTLLLISLLLLKGISPTIGSHT